MILASCSASFEKAEMLNNQFHSVFTKEPDTIDTIYTYPNTLLPDKGSSPHPISYARY